KLALTGQDRRANVAAVDAGNREASVSENPERPHRRTLQRVLDRADRSQPQPPLVAAGDADGERVVAGRPHHGLVGDLEASATVGGTDGDTVFRDREPRCRAFAGPPREGPAWSGCLVC